MQQEQEEEQPGRELRKGDKLGRQGGSGIMTRKRRLPRCDFFASFRHPPSGPQVCFFRSFSFFESLDFCRMRKGRQMTMIPRCRWVFCRPFWFGLCRREGYFFLEVHGVWFHTESLENVAKPVHQFVYV